MPNAACWRKVMTVYCQVYN